MQTKKIKVGILGATGSVGQKFIELLSVHPEFEINELAASDRSAGKLFGESVNWIINSRIPQDIAKLKIKSCGDRFESKFLFSALDASAAEGIEPKLANRGHIIISNAKNQRWNPTVPLVIPEVNADHLDLLKYQTYDNGGLIITNPNCSTIGLVLSLKPLDDLFGVEAVNVVTMQAISGAGYPGIPSIDIVDNVIPFINGEEEKLETEPLKILGTLQDENIYLSDIKISAQCNRVFVKDGHLETVQIKLKKEVSSAEIINAWKNFKGESQKFNLHSAPANPIHYLDDVRYPQPRLHRDLDKGMATVIGRLRKCNLFDYKYVLLSHNTVRGAAGGTILIAELLKAKLII